MTDPNQLLLSSLRSQLAIEGAKEREAQRIYEDSPTGSRDESTSFIMKKISSATIKEIKRQIKEIEK